MNSNQIMAEQQLDNDNNLKFENGDEFDENQAEGSNDDNIGADNTGSDDNDDYDETRIKLDADNAPSNGDDQMLDDAEMNNPNNIVVINQDNNNVSANVQDNNYAAGSEDPEDLAQVKNETVDPNMWSLPADKDVCTLEEIRRGQVINRVAPNECPVPGCGKKINESSLEPSPGTISSGLRTHVLFVHYANRKGVKKRKLGWSTKRRSSASPKKQFAMSQSAMRSSPLSNGDPDFDNEPENFAFSTYDMQPPLSSGSSLIQKSYNTQNRVSPPGSLLNKKIKQLSSGQTSQTQQQSSIQSLMQATGMGFGSNNGARFSPQTKQKGQDLSASQKSFNQTTSSLFSILAGLTQQPQQQSHQKSHLSNQSQQSSLPRNVKAAHSANTINVSQCSKNANYNSNNGNFMTNPPMNSSLLSLLNEKISGNVASSLQSQLKKTLDSNQNIKVPSTSTPSSRTNVSTSNNPYYQTNLSNNDNNNFNNGTSLLNGLCSNNGDMRLTHNESLSSLNPFIESIAKRTGSNIGPAGVAEAKKIIEKFTTWLICSSQTIADHYIAPYANEAPQQKPEIGASDVILAYKMMQKSHPQ